MKAKKNLYWLLLIILVIFGVFYFNRDKQTPSNNSGINNVGMNRQNCLSDDCLLVDNLEYPVGDLTKEAKDALNKAIDDEYKAMSTYQKIIDKFGMVRPFSIIKNAEEQHIASLKAVFDKYGLIVPNNTWLEKTKAPDTLKQACQIGVEAEIANAKLYREELLPAVKNYEDITAVFTNLMNASEQKHLVAFEKCN